MEADQQAEEEKKASPSQKWLAAIKVAEAGLSKWQSSCDRIEKLYASLSEMDGAKGDREFQIFWANMELLKPSVYQRAPQPVVTPRHSDTGEVPRKASEMLERALSFDVEFDDLHETLLMVRDDLTLSGRGVPWVLDDSRCIHVDRRDFVHDLARKWQEVDWVARRAYLSRDAGVERFGEQFHKAKFENVGEDRDDDYKSAERKAQVWEIWCRSEAKVFWVTEGIENALEVKGPLIDVKGFFPCPKPAYATLERGTLKPVPDFTFYRDQVDEINELTARISELAESLRLRGFYDAGGDSEGSVGDAIEAALKNTSNKAVMVPVSTNGGLANRALKDSVIWLPVSEVAQVIQACIELRKQLIQDVYEITGLSDIMRGVTQAQETLGAQNLKAQYGSVRVREKQSEMVRVGLEVLRIKAEIMAETYPVDELATMAGMKLPTDADLQQMQAQAQAQGQQLPPTVTLDSIGKLLKSERMRPFAMEIETDSTIAPNEEAEKQSRVEFLQAVGSFLGMAGPMVQQQPETAPFMAELLKFGVGAFRAGRDLGGEIEQFAEQVKARAASQGQQPNPEAIKAQAEAQAKQMELQLKAREVSVKEAEIQYRMQTASEKNQLDAMLKA
ncbi:MAG: hypothetical protein GY701_15920, partial [Sulfitobacter sp.]|nr:hypothetical protein [Sulfitobacter sp.]